MNPNLISSSYLKPFEKTFHLSKPADYFTRIISLHYINSLLHFSTLLAKHRNSSKTKINENDVDLATQLLQDPIKKAEYKINHNLLNSQTGGKKKIIIRKKQNKQIVDKVISIENNRLYQQSKKQTSHLNKNELYKPYSKLFTQFKKDNSVSINIKAKNRIALLSNELLSQLLTLSYQKTQLIPNNHTIKKNDILYTLLEL